MSTLPIQLDPATWIIIVTNPHDTTRLFDRLKRTTRAGNRIFPIQTTANPIAPVGTSAHDAIYQLGHAGRSVRPVTQLSPNMVRQLREVAYLCRRDQSNLHLFGFVDSHSPFGSRAMLEHSVRLLRDAHIPIQLHIGVWQPTPTEFRLGLRELASLCRDSTNVASVFPIETIKRNKMAERYIDGILHPETSDSISSLRLPLHHPKFLQLYQPTDNDNFFILNHELNGMPHLSEAIRANTGKTAQVFDINHPSNKNIEEKLNQSKHIVGISHRPEYLSSYFGSALHHPSFETLVLDKPTEVLEMLISPHFGVQPDPYATIVILDEVTHPDFDWLVSSLLKLQQNKKYNCLLLDPDSLEDDWLITNQQTQPDQAIQVAR